ncbi:hypothetical protein [Thermus filiformis]|uniref:Uncharacterized protein n=1 Tax=Thermus filiformis TaxID=276 RepID=A0A0A2WPV8_THEFI|nr:hypothetical protein [Thermus filiformis]KGQ21863.1 hypothetical protein THFILI_10205 [Thermus filiformis]
MLVYLDQNYASRMAKHLLGQKGHVASRSEHLGAFGRLFLALRGSALAPPSPFYHPSLACAKLGAPVKPFPGLLGGPHPRQGPEEKAGYLLPALKRVFGELSQGYWVRPWLEVAFRQTRGVYREDLLWRKGSWEEAADLSPLQGLEEGLEGPLAEREERVKQRLMERTGLKEVPFVRLFARLLAQDSLNAARKKRPSDLLDFAMAATLYPYVDLLLTDRYLRALLGPRAVGGRKKEVEALLAHLAQGVNSGR